MFNYFVGIIYLNIYVLVPKLLFRERAALYLMTIGGVALGTYFFFLGVEYSILKPLINLFRKRFCTINSKLASTI